MPKPSTERVIKKVLKKIVPKPAEKKRLEKLAAKMLELTNKEAIKHEAYAIIAGSLTRDTWLLGKMEFDIFVLFPPETPVEKMEKTGLEIGKKVIKKMRGSYVIEYAEHPYVSGKIKKMDIDIVPCYELKSTEELKSSVDRTPFHVRYIEKNLPRKLANDVRLLKQLCGAHGVYGADAKTEGFSGYVCELIVVNYDSFMAAAKAIAGWRFGEIIDIQDFYTKDDYAELRRKFKQQPLILIDPTDSKRNTAAALSHQNFQKLKKVANNFLKAPAEKMFFPPKKKPLKLAELKKLQKSRDTELIVVKFKPPVVVPDILWPQMRRFASRLESILKENEFYVLRKDVYTNEKDLAVVLLEMKNCVLPAVRKRVGPSVYDKKGADNFVKKYKARAISGPFIEGGFWAVEVKRKFRTAESKLKDSLSDSFEILKAKGVPSHIAKQISKKFILISDAKKIEALTKKDKNLGIFLRDYFEKESLA